jgi:hypothetical protein
MRKLLFLLLMAVAMVGFVTAVETAHPPWAFALEAEISSIGADYCIITLDTAPEQQAVLSYGVIANNVIDILTLAIIDYRHGNKALNTGHRAIDYNLRL